MKGSVEPWESEQEFWVSAHRLLLDLHRLRMRATIKAVTDADGKIRSFCQRLRGSPHLIVARIQREYRVPDAGIVLVLHVAAVASGLCSPWQSRSQALLTACGFSPARQITITEVIQHDRGWGRLFEIESGHLCPSYLLTKALKGGDWPDWQIAEYKKAVRELPERIALPCLGISTTQPPPSPKTPAAQHASMIPPSSGIDKCSNCGARLGDHDLERVGVGIAPPEASAMVFDYTCAKCHFRGRWLWPQTGPSNVPAALRRLASMIEGGRNPGPCP